MRKRDYLKIIALTFLSKFCFIPNAYACENSQADNLAIVRVELEDTKPALGLIIDQFKKDEGCKSQLKNDQLIIYKDSNQVKGSLSDSYIIPYWIGIVESILINNTHPLNLHCRLTLSSILEKLYFEDSVMQYLIENFGRLRKSELQYFINVLDIELSSTVEGKHFIQQIIKFEN